MISVRCALCDSGVSDALATPPLQGLLDVIPEARLNLVIHFMRHGDLAEAHELVQELEPGTPQVCAKEILRDNVIRQKLSSLTPILEFPIAGVCAKGSG